MIAKMNTATRRWIDFCKIEKRPVVSFSLRQSLAYLDYCVNDLHLTFYAIRASKEFLFAVLRLLIKPFSESDKECITKYIQGVFNKRPPIPHRNRMVTWNVDVVLDYFTSAGDNEGLPLNDLAGKISMLVMLSTMCRLSDVSQLDINNMTETPNFLEFRLDTPTKTFTEYNMAFGGSGLQTLTLHRFVDDERLCPAQVILKYISRTAGFCGQVHRLFVIVGEWSKQASMQSISCWTKLILNKAGLGKFTVHSGRSASSSCALLLGMPIDAILRHAGWKSKSSFVRRYMKHPLTAVTDKHGFSKVWGLKLGERVTPSIDGRVQHFLAHSQVDDVFCRENQKEDAITSISVTELRQCPSSLIQTGKLQQSLKAPQPTLELTSCPVL